MKIFNQNMKMALSEFPLDALYAKLLTNPDLYEPLKNYIEERVYNTKHSLYFIVYTHPEYVTFVSENRELCINKIIKKYKSFDEKYILTEDSVEITTRSKDDDNIVYTDTYFVNNKGSISYYGKHSMNNVWSLVPCLKYIFQVPFHYLFKEYNCSYNWDVTKGTLLGLKWYEMFNINSKCKQDEKHKEEIASFHNLVDENIVKVKKLVNDIFNELKNTFASLEYNYSPVIIKDVILRDGKMVDLAETMKAQEFLHVKNDNKKVCSFTISYCTGQFYLRETSIKNEFNKIKPFDKDKLINVIKSYIDVSLSNS